MSETTVTEQLVQLRDVPTLGVPRETLLALAMSARMISGALRESREKRGRAAWNEDDEGPRLHLAADAASIDRLTKAQADEWNDRVKAGDVGVWTQGNDRGLVLADAELSDGAHIMQATLGDRTVTVASGSAETASHLKEWLIANPTHDSLGDLREAANEVARSRTWTPGARSHAATEDVSSQTQTHTDGLRERLQGRIPDEVFADARWGVAERQYADLIAQGADATELADAVAGLKFDNKVRTPAGLVAWQLRKAAQGQTSPTSEDQARREAATEWLAGASESPTDRARASTLVGQIDTDFDRTLADKYPGILTADPEGQWHDHNGRAKSEADRGEVHENTAERVEEESLAVIHGPTEVSEPEHSQAVGNETYAAAERQAMSIADSARAQEAATPAQAAERAAAAPLTRAGQGPVQSPSRRRARPATARPSAPTQKQTRARTR